MLWTQNKQSKKLKGWIKFYMNDVDLENLKKKQYQDYMNIMGLEIKW